MEDSRRTSCELLANFSENFWRTFGELLETFGERYGEDNEHGDQLILVMKRLLSGPNRIWALAALD